jgi:hypothetical protein
VAGSGELTENRRASSHRACWASLIQHGGVSEWCFSGRDAGNSGKECQHFITPGWRSRAIHGQFHTPCIAAQYSRPGHRHARVIDFVQCVERGAPISTREPCPSCESCPLPTAVWKLPTSNHAVAGGQRRGSHCAGETRNRDPTPEGSASVRSIGRGTRIPPLTLRVDRP